MSENLTIEDISYHRNGISGEGFHVVTFQDAEEGAMVAILFDIDTDEDGNDALDRGEFYNCPTAVFNRQLLGEGNIKFGSNSYRGDNFDVQLRRAVKVWSNAWTIEDGYADPRVLDYS